MKIMRSAICLISLGQMINVLGMDQIEKKPSSLLSQLPVVVRMRCDHFPDLVVHNAALLKHLVSKEPHGYCKELRTAEATLCTAFRSRDYQPIEKSVLIMKNQCDQDTINFIRSIACKQQHCLWLLEAINKRERYSLATIFALNRYAVHCYFTCPESNRKITPLHYALAKTMKDDRYAECVQALLSAGANSNAADDIGNAPLHKVSKPRYIDLLLQFGALVNRKNNFGYTPLISRIRDYDNESASRLIHSGADLNIQDCDGNTALHHAVNENNDDLVKVLLQHGAKFDVQNKNGKMPFDSQLGMMKRNIVEPYIQALLCIALHRDDSKTVSHLVQNFSWMSFVVNGTSIMEWAKQHCGKSSKSVCTFEKELLHQLFFTNACESARLIAAGAPVNMPGYDKVLPLVWAIRYGDINKVAVLLNKGALVTQVMIDDARSEDVRTILNNAYNKQLYGE